MTSTELDGVLNKIRKLLMLAESNPCEQESLRAMEHVHRLLAAHNLSIEDTKARPSRDNADRTLDETQFDSPADRWTVRVWHATASLFFCRYFFGEETRLERGRRRPIRLRHSIVGTRANQVTAKVMADHFCRTVRRLARGYAADAPRKLIARRSFEAGCADRLTERVWERRAQSTVPGQTGSQLPALLTLYERESAANEAALAAMGITLQSGKRPPERKCGDVLAQHMGREAADAISLALQIGGGSPKTWTERKSTEPSQMGFAF